MKNQNDQATNISRYFFQLSAESYTGNLACFQSDLIEAIHDHSEPFTCPETGSSYRSLIGISLPKFGYLEQYVTKVFASDLAFRIRFAKKHPAEYIGDVIHCVSSEKAALLRFQTSATIQRFKEEGIAVSDILLVPSDCPEACVKRDRRTERRTEKKLLSNHEMFNISEKHLEPDIPTVEEPLPAINRIKKSDKTRYGLNIRIDSGHVKPTIGWYSVFGLSKKGSTVPILPVLGNTNKHQ